VSDKRAFIGDPRDELGNVVPCRDCSRRAKWRTPEGDFCVDHVGGLSANMVREAEARRRQREQRA